MTPPSAPRLFYIDNIRILLISLIVLLHLAITYGAPGGWYYREVKFEDLNLVSSVLFTLFNTTVQAFSLGFFFMISGYFTSASITKKGTGTFISDRLLRLGVPLLFYCIVINPFLIYVLWGNGRSIGTFITDYFSKTRSVGAGPLWFVEALIIFTFVYLVVRLIAGKKYTTYRTESNVPGNAAIALYALIVGLISFTVRIWLPVGWNFELLNFQFPFFAQYIGMFALGIIAYQNNWLDRIPEKQGRFWFITATVLVATFPVFLSIVFLSGGIDSVIGGLHWESLYYAVWEQFVCIGMVVGLSVLFRKKYNFQGIAAKAMSGAAYGVFIFHAPVLVLLGLTAQSIRIYPLAKFFLMAPVALTLTFLLSFLIKKIPGIGRII